MLAFWMGGGGSAVFVAAARTKTFDVRFSSHKTFDVDFDSAITFDAYHALGVVEV